MKETPQGVSVVKCGIGSVNWNEHYHPRLLQHVSDVNQATTQTYFFARYILLQEFSKGLSDDLSYITESFFKQIFMALTVREREQGARAPETLKTRKLIADYLEGYMGTGFSKVPLRNPASAANNEACRMFTAYKNNISCYFGEQLHHVVNVLMNVHTRVSGICKKLKGKPGQTRKSINAACREQVYEPARRLKEAIRSRTPDTTNLDDFALEQFAKLQGVLSAYKDDYKFRKDDRYYDVKAAPLNHLKAYYHLAVLLEKEHKASIQPFPIRRSWIPAHTLIDLPVLRANILDRTKEPHAVFDRNEKDPKKAWSKVLDMQSAPMKDKHKREFQGSAFTDGVSICIIHKTDTEVERCHTQHQKRTNNTAGPASDLASASASASDLASASASASASVPNSKPKGKRKYKRKSKDDASDDDSEEKPEFQYINKLTPDELSKFD
ncbi:hypothetical protein H4R20_006708, partial [Coemansia guatemalensis]